MQMSTGTQQSLAIGLFSNVSTYRYNVFVKQLGWDLNTPEGIELDQFDCPQRTVYVVSQHDNGEINGCARLLPTDGAYLLAEVFPQLLNGMTPPNDADVWELSRFAAVDLSQQSAGCGQFSSPVAVALLQAAMDCAKAHGAKRMISVSPVGVERLLQRAGFHAHRAGAPMIINGHALVAVWIELEN